jgi:cell division protein ZapA (FtsZ GTPase activity inhibitor)
LLRKQLSNLRPRTVDVEIYDQKYSIVLKSSLSESEVRTLADEVDMKMRDIASQANTADSLKVAVLTALHLAQEYRELRRNCDQKTDEWSRALEQVLKK